MNLSPVCFPFRTSCRDFTARLFSVPGGTFFDIGEAFGPDFGLNIDLEDDRPDGFEDDDRRGVEDRGFGDERRGLGLDECRPFAVGMCRSVMRNRDLIRYAGNYSKNTQ